MRQKVFLQFIGFLIVVSNLLSCSTDTRVDQPNRTRSVTFGNYPRSIEQELFERGYLPWSAAWGPVSPGDIIDSRGDGVLQVRWKGKDCFKNLPPPSRAGKFEFQLATVSVDQFDIGLGFIEIAGVEAQVHDIVVAQVSIEKAEPIAIPTGHLESTRSLPNCKQGLAGRLDFATSGVLLGHISVKFFKYAEAGGKLELLHSLPNPLRLKAEVKGFTYRGDTGTLTSKEPIILGILPAEGRAGDIRKRVMEKKGSLPMHVLEPLRDSVKKFNKAEITALRTSPRIVEELEDTAHTVRIELAYVWLPQGEYYTVKLYDGHAVGDITPLTLTDFTPGQAKQKLFDIEHPDDEITGRTINKFAPYKVLEADVDRRFKLGYVRFTHGGMCADDRAYDFIILGPATRFRNLERLQLQIFLPKPTPRMLDEGQFRIVQLKVEDDERIFSIPEDDSELLMVRLDDSSKKKSFKLIGTTIHQAKLSDVPAIDDEKNYEGFEIVFRPKKSYAIGIPCQAIRTRR
jgi:hypothetical protein